LQVNEGFPVDLSHSLLISVWEKEEEKRNAEILPSNIFLKFKIFMGVSLFEIKETK